MRTALLVTGFFVAVVALACGGDDNNGTPAGANGRCAADVAAQPCGANCAFDPGAIDCAAACQNVASICASGACGAQCTGLNQDVALCTAACQGTKQLSCTNVSFGCYGSSTDCTAVGNCVASKL